MGLPSPWVLRVSGWIVSLAGGAILVLSGGFGGDAKNPLPWIGAIVFVFGMILTSASGLVAQLKRMRALRKPSAPPPSSPPEPPATPG